MNVDRHSDFADESLVISVSIVRRSFPSRSMLFGVQMRKYALMSLAALLLAAPAFAGWRDDDAQADDAGDDDSGAGAFAWGDDDDSGGCGC